MSNGTTGETSKRRRPGLTPEARENQIIADAYDLAEQQIRNGTASSQIITHFLKLGSSMVELEKIKMMHDIELTKAKAEAIQASQHSEELYENAIKAMQRYSGQGVSEDDDY